MRDEDFSGIRILGAGKTTFIRHLQNVPKDFAVMENEYGAVNVDGDLLEQTNDLNIWELTEGVSVVLCRTTLPRLS
ncbi:MAG: GTP-binding protein [Clostridia bacterium]